MSHALADFLAAAEAIVSRHDFSPDHEIGRRGWLIDATSGRPRFSRCIEFANPTGRLPRHMTFIIEFGDADAYPSSKKPIGAGAPSLRRRRPPTRPHIYRRPAPKSSAHSEDVPALALIDGITPEGWPVYSGASDVWWDDGQRESATGASSTSTMHSSAGPSTS